MIKRSKDMLLEEGSIFPMLTMYKKGVAMNVDEDQTIKGVVLIKNSSSYGIVSDDYIADDGETIYTSHIVFKYGDGVDERDINRASKALVRKHKPDMVGLVMSCLYTINNDGTPIDINPDTSRLLHSVFYTPVSREGSVIFIPFVNRGELPIEKKKESDGISDAVNFDVSFFDSGWSSTVGKSVKPSIGNPYPRG